LGPSYSVWLFRPASGLWIKATAVVQY